MNFITKNLNIFFSFLIIKLIVFYQIIISPLIPARCRYYPTCSNYGKQALAWHGVRSGSWLLIKRLGRCHPFGGHGIDFVPLPLDSYQYYYVPVATISSITTQNLGIYTDHHSYVSRLNHLMSST